MKPAVTVVGVALSLAALLAAPAGAGGSFVEFDPDPAYPGATVTVTVVGGFSECNNPGGAESFITLDAPGDDIEGSFPGGTNVGTLVIPSDLPEGTYNVLVQCTFSLGNSVFYPTNPLVIGQVPPTTTTTTTAVTTTDPPGQSSTTAPAARAAAAAVTEPRFTG